MQNILEAKYELYASLDEMLAPETLSRILKRRVMQVTCQPFSSTDSYSGSKLYRITADGERLFMKRSNPDQDWMLIATDDHKCRAVQLWHYGLLDRLQPGMDHATLAACRDGDDHVLLMQDISDGLFSGKEITSGTIFALLDAQAAMHALFWENDDLKNPELGLCNVEQTVKTFWPEHCERYRHDALAVEQVTKGWEALFEYLQPDVRDAVQSLTANPQPLWDKLAQFPYTLIHGDYRLGNLAIMPDTNQVVAFDWQRAGYAPASLCASWFIMTGDLFHMQGVAAEYYRQCLSTRLSHRFDPDLWYSMFEVGNMVDVLRKGCWHALFASTTKDEGFRNDMRQSLATYDDIVRKGLTWL